LELVGTVRVVVCSPKNLTPIDDEKVKWMIGKYRLAKTTSHLDYWPRAT
jgi:hypothetical protein